MYSTPAAAAGFGSRAQGQSNPFSTDSAGAGLSKKNRRKKLDEGQWEDISSGQDSGRSKRARMQKRVFAPASDKHQTPRRDRRRDSPAADVSSESTGFAHASRFERSPSPPPPLPESDDPYAASIYRQLQADRISPPQWPANPGSVDSKSAMSKFREQHEDYRQRVRRSLTKAGLIDDPNKRKKLSEAISFKGICDDMCPEYEKIQRITESDVVKAEKRGGVVDLKRMVKKLARSAAGQEAPLPMDVRSTRALAMSLNYMFGRLLGDDENLRQLHGFVWDRTRAIRRDFAFFSSMNETEITTHVYVLESIARFHVTALHLLPKFVGPGDKVEDLFSEHQELEQLGKTLLSLRDVYDDCRTQGLVCPNEAEFRAYYLLFHGRDPEIIDTLQVQWDHRLWDESKEVQTALALVEMMQNNLDPIGSVKHREAGPLLACASACTSFFDVVEDASTSYTMACFAECHFPYVRRAILQTVKRSLGRPRQPVEDVTAETLNSFLRYDTVEQAVEFAEMHGFSFVPNAEDPSNINKYGLVLKDVRASVPYVKIDHQFSQRLVEKKRGKTPLPEVLRQTIYDQAGPSEQMPNGGREEGMFVQDEFSPEPVPLEPVPPAEAGVPEQAAPAQDETCIGDEAPRKPTARIQGGFVVESGMDELGRVQ